MNPENTPTPDSTNQPQPLAEPQNPTNNVSTSPQPQPQQPFTASPTKRKLNVLVTIVASLAVVIILAIVLLRLFIFEPYKENGLSMVPTIKNGGQVLIMKGHSQPKIGDLIVFTQSGLSQYGQPNTLQLIKRVVGLPGDSIQIVNGKLTVFNSADPNGFDPDDSDGLSNIVTSGNIKMTVPSGDVYVLGDNRPQSLDSREFGPVPIKNIIGKVVHIF